MKIKQSLAALTLVTVFGVSFPVAAFAATVSPRIIRVSQQMDFSPYVYGLLLLTAVLLCVIAALSIQVFRLRQNLKLIGKGLYDIGAHTGADSAESFLDYCDIETPEEFAFYAEQSNKIVEEAITRLCNKPPYVPRHQRVLEVGAAENADTPHIRLLPEMKYARKKAAHAPSLEIPEELEELLRKIS